MTHAFLLLEFGNFNSSDKKLRQIALFVLLLSSNATSTQLCIDFACNLDAPGVNVASETVCHGRARTPTGRARTLAMWP
ncbi:hypothetical protein EYF80_059916 [Liparis tanakae]|uniref:Uncharacterized protein n=1 Tax=Liparis tanakae TaxID=230148 RepID=A0A4Z2EN78_9TELE|nr:hypothetical protein EYF80_059916 [Liparis tanakae]